MMGGLISINMKQVLFENKNVFMQKIRGILIILVILIHSISASKIIYENYLFVFLRTISNLAVPAFLFLSGYYFNKNKYIDDVLYIKKKISRLIIPLLIWNVVYFIFSDNKVLSGLFFFNTSPHLYFIVVLIQLILLTPLIMKYKVIKLILCLVTPIYLLIYRLTWMANSQIIIPAHQYYFFAWSIYYVFGIIVRELRVFKNIKKVHLLFLFVITFIYNCLIYHFFGFDYSCSQMNIMNMILSLSMCIYLASNIKQNSEISILSKIGDVSFGIYFIHIIVLKVVNKLLSFVVFDLVLLTFLKLFLTIMFSYMLIKMFCKITKNKFNNILGF